ncbi:hypothetical protein [Streptomyces microflavus]|uniref:hypothetical protein n=1 Tax=Streptomyces microflavus TaxID=1919 RepID=UPI0033C27E54
MVSRLKAPELEGGLKMIDRHRAALGVTIEICPPAHPDGEVRWDEGRVCTISHPPFLRHDDEVTLTWVLNPEEDGSGADFTETGTTHTRHAPPVDGKIHFMVDQQLLTGPSAANTPFLTGSGKASYTVVRDNQVFESRTAVFPIRLT